MAGKVLKKIMCVCLACWLAVAGVLAAVPVDVAADEGVDDCPVVTPFNIGDPTKRPPH